MESRRTRLSK